MPSGMVSSFENACVLPGSFNPLHDAHRAMMQFATRSTGRAGFFELSVTNVDKPSLTKTQLRERLAESFAPAALLLTRLPTFEAKSDAFAGAVFVVGGDTIRRINDLKYYSHQESEFRRAIARIKANGIRFLVFGRNVNRQFLDEKSLSLQPELLDLCDFVTRSDFEMDVSSTGLRNQ